MGQTKTTLFVGRVGWLRALTPRKWPRRIATPTKTTLFVGRVGWLRALIPRKFPQEIFANE
jgi:disulfide oxidoreductase YuzD